MPTPPDFSPEPPQARVEEARPGAAAGTVAPRPTAPVPEHGGLPGPEPTRFGDWERAGRCIDF